MQLIYRKKSIEVALSREATNAASAWEKPIRQVRPSAPPSRDCIKVDVEAGWDGGVNPFGPLHTLDLFTQLLPRGAKRIT